MKIVGKINGRTVREFISYDEYFEPSETTGVTLSFTVPREHLNVVKSTLLQGGGFSVSVI